MTKVTAWAWSRCVRGIPALAAQASAAVMPGVTAWGDAGFAQGFDFLAAAAEDEGVPPFEADDAVAVSGEADEQGVDFGLGHGVVARGFADVDLGGVSAGQGEDFVGAQAVMDDDVSLAEEAEGAQADEVRGTRAGADQVDEALAGGGGGEFGAPGGFGGGVVAGERQVGGGAGEDAFEDAAAGVYVRDRGAGFFLEAAGQPSEAAPGGGDEGLDFLAEEAGEDGGGAAGGHRDRDGGAVYDAGGGEAAEVRAVNDVDGDAKALGLDGEGAQVVFGGTGGGGERAAGEGCGV